MPKSMESIFMISSQLSQREYQGRNKDRIHFYVADQEDDESMKKMLEASGVDEWDIIVEDGGHTHSQQVHSFRILFPLLKRGGLYFGEDLSAAYMGHRSGGIKKGWAIFEGFFNRMVFTINRMVGPRSIKREFEDKVYPLDHSVGTKAKGRQVELNGIDWDIRSLHFYNEIVVVEKGDPNPRWNNDQRKWIRERFPWNPSYTKHFDETNSIWADGAPAGDITKGYRDWM